MLKILHPGQTYVIEDLNGKKNVGTIYEKELTYIHYIANIHYYTYIT